MGLKSRMSSAYIVSLDPLVSGREHAQFIYTRNNSGPKTEPWGTPDVTGVVPYRKIYWRGLYFGDWRFVKFFANI